MTVEPSWNSRSHTRTRILMRQLSDSLHDSLLDSWMTAYLNVEGAGEEGEEPVEAHQAEVDVVTGKAGYSIIKPDIVLPGEAGGEARE